MRLAQVDLCDTRLLRDPVEPEADETGDGDEGEIERTDHNGLSSQDGFFQRGAVVRSAERSRAERDRGLARISFSSGMRGCFPETRNVGSRA